uniref:Uncharacterized protein n=1 Tax=Rhizophora mucronata TaxID=61149 RepID=A0A2P2NAG0_RHIMU
MCFKNNSEGIIFFFLATETSYLPDNCFFLVGLAVFDNILF